ncbi:hypothetical protein SDC9_79254 [bioreactor metagenome]|uniref:Uncharacterized protein n=1 Tax=bioreactor metagenome TaxID=1076179 RepID=A0A644YWL0_9ZZZZ
MVRVPSELLTAGAAIKALLLELAETVRLPAGVSISPMMAITSRVVSSSNV